jgi:tyrosyl-tRNA synthetase
MKSALAVLKERGFIAQCTALEELDELMSKKKISFYVGVDPTADSMHVGHLVPFFAMAHLQKVGHKPIALVGGATARIGDPTGKTEMRKMLSGEDIDNNARLIGQQIQKFIPLDGENGKMVNNYDWMGDKNYIEFLRDVGKHFSVNKMLSFETYKKRMETGLSFIEFNYQLLQSYDFLELHKREDCVLQIGGDDQWGNIVAGVDLIRRVQGHEAKSFGLTFPLVTTADGKKMGKTEKGALWLILRKPAPTIFSSTGGTSVMRTCARLFSTTPSFRWRKSNSSPLLRVQPSTKPRKSWPTSSPRSSTVRKKRRKLWREPRRPLALVVPQTVKVCPAKLWQSLNSLRVYRPSTSSL